MIICKRLVNNPDDHLQGAGQFGWSFARGWSIRMIICKRPVHQDDHLQEVGPSGWSFAKGRSIRMIHYERPVHPDDHLQEAGPSGWSFARGLSTTRVSLNSCVTGWLSYLTLSLLGFWCVPWQSLKNTAGKYAIVSPTTTVLPTP